METSSHKQKPESNVFWFRRDFRTEDNTALHHALETGIPVIPIFIFDTQILDELAKDDARLNFIHESLSNVNTQLAKYNSSIKFYIGNPIHLWQTIIQENTISQVFFNKDYEPYATARDQEITTLLQQKNITVSSFKDQVIFEENEVLKNDGTPYTIFTPFKNKWLSHFTEVNVLENTRFKNLMEQSHAIPSLAELGFVSSSKKVPNYSFQHLKDYSINRDFPGKSGTTVIGPHLRFGTVSIRKIVNQVKDHHPIYLSELIWREFFMQIMFHFPQVQNHNFKRKYDGVQWRNNAKDFELWCQGKTGYPLVDAGMRELVATGHMHNRVRMVTAGFLCKHLLIDWKWGEAFFAQHLLDYELSSNNGNWQWAAGTGCDAAPYFRIFNPIEQLKKFDKEFTYINKWIPEYNMGLYLPPMVDHRTARLRALEAYKTGIIQ